MIAGHSHRTSFFAISGSSWPQGETEPSQVRNVITPPALGGPQGHFPVAILRTRLANLSWRILFTGPYQRSKDLYLSGEVAQHSMIYEFHSCPLCRKVSQREFCVNIPSLLLVLELALSVITQDS